jgi:hypothetical protein
LFQLWVEWSSSIVTHTHNPLSQQQFTVMENKSLLTLLPSYVYFTSAVTERTCYDVSALFISSLILQ